MKVLVTGASGFLGRHLIPQLLARGHDVVATSRDENKVRAFSWHTNVQFIALDIQTPRSDTYEFLQRPNAVVHLAWDGLPQFAKALHVEKNLPASYAFLKSLVSSGTKHVLAAGTCLEYGMQCGAISEAAKTAPVIAYAMAKDMLHKSLRILASEIPFALQWARLFYMYGVGQNANSLIAQLDRSIDNGDSVFNMSPGDQIRDYLPVEDVAKRMAVLLDSPACTGAVNICSGIPISVRDLVVRHIASRSASIELNPGYYNYNEYEPAAFWGDQSKYLKHCTHV